MLQAQAHLQIVARSINDRYVVFLVTYGVRSVKSIPLNGPTQLEPSIEFAFTSWAQSVSNASGMASHVMDSGIRRYTCAEESLST